MKLEAYLCIREVLGNDADALVRWLRARGLDAVRVKRYEDAKGSVARLDGILHRCEVEGGPTRRSDSAARLFRLGVDFVAAPRPSVAPDEPQAPSGSADPMASRAGTRLSAVEPPDQPKNLRGTTHGVRCVRFPDAHAADLASDIRVPVVIEERLRTAVREHGRTPVGAVAECRVALEDLVSHLEAMFRVRDAGPSFSARVYALVDARALGGMAAHELRRAYGLASRHIHGGATEEEALEVLRSTLTALDRTCRRPFVGEP